jgi:hypothetical protein
MTGPSGLKALLDADETSSFSVIAGERFHQAAAQFDPAVLRKAADLFALGASAFDAFLRELEGRTFKPTSFVHEESVRDALVPRLKRPENALLDAVIVFPLIAVVSGAGVRVRINEPNFYTNVAYQPGGPGPEHSADVKSGRTFMSTPIHLARDTSDVAYLADLDGYLGAPDAEPSDFFRTLLELIVSCDATGYARLTERGQSVATDFIGIYTAELDRNLMDGAHAWENDLAEVTLLCSYGCAARRVNRGGRFTEGAPTDYFGIGKHGSGIGETRTERRALQRALCGAARRAFPEPVARLDRIVGADPDGDTLRALTRFLTDPQKQDAAQACAPDLVDAAVDLLVRFRTQASDLTLDIEKSGL